MNDSLSLLNKERQKQRKKNLIVLLVVLLALVVIVVFFTLPSLLQQTQTPPPVQPVEQPSAQSSEQSQPTANNQPAVETITKQPSADNNASANETSAPIEPIPTTIPAAQPEQRLTAADFKQALSTFENDWQAFNNTPDLAAWANEQGATISRLKNEAVTLFAKNDFDQAVSTLNNASELIKQTQMTWQQSYEQFFNQAKMSFDALDDVKAKTAIDEALLVKPNSAQAIQLRDRIAVLSRVSGLLEKLNIAQVENDTEQERQLLETILALDPNRDELHKRLAEIKRNIKEKDYQQQILKGLEAIDQGDVVSAKQHLANALALFSQRQEASVLASKIKQQEINIDLNRRLNALEQAMADDNWQAAATQAQDAIKYHPNDKNINQFNQLSQSILAAYQTLDGYINQPTRLGTERIVKLAQQAIDDHNHLTPFSPKLNAKIKQLEQLINQYSQTTTLRVISDNQTYIKVLGVGHIGLTTKKEVALKPNTYTLEGSREGYQSVLETVVLEPGKDTVIEIICRIKI